MRCDKLPQPFTVEAELGSSVDELLDKICANLKLETYAKDALVIKRGFPPRPTELNKARSLEESGFSAREKLIVSVDDEMVEKLRAEHFANVAAQDPV